MSAYAFDCDEDRGIGTRLGWQHGRHELHRYGTEAVVKTKHIHGDQDSSLTNTVLVAELVESWYRDTKTQTSCKWASEHCNHTGNNGGKWKSRPQRSGENIFMVRARRRNATSGRGTAMRRISTSTDGYWSGFTLNPMAPSEEISCCIIQRTEWSFCFEHNRLCTECKTYTV